ncbi:hypothetical protein AMBR_MGDJBKAP_02223 [Leuconostoc pseudomesenteroides]|nr:hypothetical protein AMBR_MGDJBKAP_02223 [Leuconostoc pseudomesenteroides]
MSTLDYRNENIQNRLKRSAGQINGIVNMIDEKRPCEEIVMQLTAVKSSIDKAIKLVIATNIEHCSGPEIDSKEYRKALDLLVKSK